MATIFHTWPYGRFTDIKSNLKWKKLHRVNQGSYFLGGCFSNRDHLRAIIKFRRESQPSINRSNETSCVFPALKPKSHFPPQSTVPHRSDSSSEANSNCCHWSDTWSHFEYRVVSPAQMAILQITSSGRSLMYNGKSVGPRMEASRTPVLPGSSYEDLRSRTTWSHLLLRKKGIRPNIWPEIPYDLSLWKRPACQSLLKAFISNTAAPVAPDLLKALAILSDTTVRKSAVHWEDLKPYWKLENRPHFSRWLTILLFTSFLKT